MCPTENGIELRNRCFFINIVNKVLAFEEDISILSNLNKHFKNLMV